MVEESDAPEFSDAPAKLEVSKDEKKENEGFLAKLEKQIDSLSMRNDAREHDDELKPSSRDEPDASSDEAPGTGEAPAKETPEQDLAPAPEPSAEERQKESDIAETLEGANPETEKPVDENLGAAPDEAPKKEENPEV